MTTTNVVQLHPQPIGLSAELPSLRELSDSLRMNFDALDEIDQGFASGIFIIAGPGEEAKIEDIDKCRAIAWSILTRYGLA